MPVGFEFVVLCPIILLAFVSGGDFLMSLTGAIFIAEGTFALMAETDGEFFATVLFAHALVRGDLISDAADDKATEVPLSILKNILFEACTWKNAPMADT